MFVNGHHVEQLEKGYKMKYGSDSKKESVKVNILIRAMHFLGGVSACVFLFHHL
jgi:hypothetical protein